MNKTRLTEAWLHVDAISSDHIELFYNLVLRLRPWDGTEVDKARIVKEVREGLTLMAHSQTPCPHLSSTRAYVCDHCGESVE